MTKTQFLMPGFKLNYLVTIFNSSSPFEMLRPDYKKMFYFINDCFEENKRGGYKWSLFHFIDLNPITRLLESQA